MSAPAADLRPLARSAARWSGVMRSSEGGRGRGGGDAVSVTKHVSRDALDGAVEVSFSAPPRTSQTQTATTGRMLEV